MMPPQLEAEIGKGITLPPIPNPRCYGMQEVSTGPEARAHVFQYLYEQEQNPKLSSRIQTHFTVIPEPDFRVDPDIDNPEISMKSIGPSMTLFTTASEPGLSPLPKTPLFIHLAHGLALTVGSALGSTPPSTQTCLAAFELPNSVSLTAGARAWTKHAHRSQPPDNDGGVEKEKEEKQRKQSAGWWGTPSGPVATINERASTLFWKVMDSATWRNLHWLPHQTLVYEVRVEEGYGMRWSQDQSSESIMRSGDVEGHENDNQMGKVVQNRPWVFRGFVEPMMENGHEVGWRHPS